jgi:hypothetical protein
MWGTRDRGEFTAWRVEVRGFPHLKIEMWGACLWVEVRAFPHLKIEMWGTRDRGEFTAWRVEVRGFPHLKIEMWGTRDRGEFTAWRVEVRAFPHLKIEMWGTDVSASVGWLRPPQKCYVHDQARQNNWPDLLMRPGLRQFVQDLNCRGPKICIEAKVAT